MFIGKTLKCKFHLTTITSFTVGEIIQTNIEATTTNQLCGVKCSILFQHRNHSMVTVIPFPPLTSIEDFYWVSIIWPSFELPGWAQCKYCYNTIPITKTQLGWVVYYTVRYRQTSFFGSLDKHLRLTFGTMCSLFLMSNKSAIIIYNDSLP